MMPNTETVSSKSVLAGWTKDKTAFGARISLCMTLVACFFFMIAAVIPSWVVLSVDGSGKVLGHAYDVDFNIGSGMFRKNVCYGGDKPDQDFLDHFGLSCNGKSQTKKCTRDSLRKDDPEYNEECSRFVTAQVTQCLAILIALSVVLVGACSLTRRHTLLSRSCAVLSSVLIVAFAAGALGTMKQTHFMAAGEDHLGCAQVIDAIEVCHERGISFSLQGWGIFFSCVAVLAELVLLGSVVVHGEAL